MYFIEDNCYQITLTIRYPFHDNHTRSMLMIIKDYWYWINSLLASQNPFADLGSQRPGKGCCDKEDPFVKGWG